MVVDWPSFRAVRLLISRATERASHQSFGGSSRCRCCCAAVTTRRHGKAARFDGEGSFYTVFYFYADFFVEAVLVSQYFLQYPDDNDILALAGQCYMQLVNQAGDNLHHLALSNFLFTSRHRLWQCWLCLGLFQCYQQSGQCALIRNWLSIYFFGWLSNLSRKICLGTSGRWYFVERSSAFGWHGVDTGAYWTAAQRCFAASVEMVHGFFSAQALHGSNLCTYCWLPRTRCCWLRLLVCLRRWCLYYRKFVRLFVFL